MNRDLLRIEPRKALATLEAAILAGYQLKDTFEPLWKQDPHGFEAKTSGLHVAVNEWVKTTMGALESIFTSSVESYNFRDAKPPRSAVVSTVPGRDALHRLQDAVQWRLNKLNEYKKGIEQGAVARVSRGGLGGTFKSLLVTIVAGLVVAGLAFLLGWV